MRKAHLILVGLLLSFAVNATNDIPRPEYPRPQFERTTWVNLNGAWTYEFDFNNSGEKRNLQAAKSLSKQLWFLSARKVNYLALTTQTL